MNTVSTRQRFSEPWTTTALRTIGLALLVALGVSIATRHWRLFPLVVVMALWFTLGGHFAELLFRNGLAGHLRGRALAAVSRLVFWFASGSLLFIGMQATARLAGGRPLSWPWWAGGAAFIAAELLVHLGLRVRGQPSFYDDRG